MKPLGIVGQPQQRQGNMYDERFVTPMREDLTSAGFRELRSEGEVDATLKDSKGTVLVMVNSVCGCAAGRARPGVKLALRTARIKPDQLTTVFAGQDPEPTARARSYFKGNPPTSPQIALFKDGELVYMMQRHAIEGRDAAEIATDLTAAFEAHCG
ncbi:MAG TPA: BrxA/BrxB family bacilliredoxin [Gemmatimonadales bacterium]|jgi:putative YphP/YqiW family bacilliredoxin